MSDKRIEVEFGAKTSELTQGADTAAKAVDGFSKASTSATSKAEAVWGKLSPIFSQVGGAITNVGGAAEISGGLMVGAFAGLASVLAGGAIVAQLRPIIDAMDETSKGAQRMGLTTQALSELAYVGKLADVDMGSLQRTMSKLSSTLSDAQAGQKQAVEMFDRLKFDPKSFEDADQLLMAIADRFSNMDDGAAKTALAVDLLGERVGPGLIPFLNQGRDGIEELREEARRLGVTFGTETGQEAEAFNDNLTKMEQKTAGVVTQIAVGLLPALVDVTNTLADTKDASAATWKEVGEGLGSAVKVVAQTLQILWENVKFTFLGVGREIGAIAAQIVALSTLDIKAFNAISEAVKADGVKARQELDKVEARILGIGKITGVGENDPAELARRGRGPKNRFVPGAKPPEEEKKKPPVVTPPKEAMPESAMPRLQSELDAQRLMFAELNNGRELSKSAELSYWEEVQRTADLTSKDQLAVLKNVSTLKLGIMRDESRVREQLATDAAAHAQDMALAEVDFDQQAAQLSVQLGETTAEQLLAQQEQFEARRHAIKLSALQNQQAGLDPTMDPVAYAQITAQIELLEAQHQQNLAGIRGQAAIESGRTMTGIGQSLESGFSGVLAKIGTSITSIGGLMRGMGQVVLQTFTQMLAQMAAKWLANKLIMKGISKAAAIGQLGEEAAKAGAGGVASMAAAPFPLNLGAPAFGASMSALAMSFAPLASAAGGYDIPAGVNPLVQTHAKEMILPAKYADVIRGMADGRGDSDEDEGEGGGKVVKFYGTPDDTVRASQLPDMLRELGANFEFVRGFNR